MTRLTEYNNIIQRFFMLLIIFYIKKNNWSHLHQNAGQCTNVFFLKKKNKSKRKRSVGVSVTPSQSCLGTYRPKWYKSDLSMYPLLPDDDFDFELEVFLKQDKRTPQQEKIKFTNGPLTLNVWSYQPFHKILIRIDYSSIDFY